MQVMPSATDVVASPYSSSRMYRNRIPRNLEPLRFQRRIPPSFLTSCFNLPDKQWLAFVTFVSLAPVYSGNRRFIHTER